MKGLSAIERRLTALEQTREAEPLVRAEQFIGDPGVDANTVKLVGGGERLPLDEWERRYPTGVLITIDLGDDSDPIRMKEAVIHVR